MTNKVGPVRAIRSYLGASSGLYTQREHPFYERRQTITTMLRVHAIPGILDFFDYGPAAVGMRYHNDLNPAGVPIDGVPDLVAAGPLGWELVTGPQGSLVMAHRIETTIAGFASTAYYLDDARHPRDRQCTGDRDAYG